MPWPAPTSAEHAVDPPGAPAPIVHHLLTVAPADRMAVLAALAAGGKRSLIFTRTKHGARKLARQLTAAHVPAAEVHGDLTQTSRERNLARFACGAVRVLVATDIAARGIHVDGIDLVIHDRACWRPGQANSPGAPRRRKLTISAAMDGWTSAGDNATNAVANTERGDGSPSLPASLHSLSRRQRPPLPGQHRRWLIT
jgi:hypothetical protein